MKQDFINKYMTKYMKGHGLPYGMAYFNLRDETEEKAIEAWKAKERKLNRGIIKYSY